MLYNGYPYMNYYNPYMVYYPNNNVVMNNANAPVNEGMFQFKQVQTPKKEEDEYDKQKQMNEVALSIIEHIERLKEELKVLKNNNNNTLNNRNVDVNKTKGVVNKYESILTREDMDVFKDTSKLSIKSTNGKYINDMMRNKPSKNLK